jgi:hypothetical protein
VNRRTILLLLRLRFTVEEPGKRPLLAEEVNVFGFRGFPPDHLQWLTEGEGIAMLHNARPDVNVPAQERREVLEEVLGWWEDLQTGVKPLIEKRATKLEEAHRRVRAAAYLARRGMAVKVHMPPDLLSTLVLLPIPKGVAT